MCMLLWKWDKYVVFVISGSFLITDMYFRVVVMLGNMWYATFVWYILIIIETILETHSSLSIHEISASWAIFTCSNFQKTFKKVKLKVKIFKNIIVSKNWLCHNLINKETNKNQATYFTQKMLSSSSRKYTFIYRLWYSLDLMNNKNMWYKNLMTFRWFM